MVECDYPKVFFMTLSTYCNIRETRRGCEYLQAVVRVWSDLWYAICMYMEHVAEVKPCIDPPSTVSQSDSEEETEAEVVAEDKTETETESETEAEAEKASARDC